MAKRKPRDPGPTWVKSKTGSYRLRGQASEEEILDFANCILEHTAIKGRELTNAADTKQYLKCRLGTEEREVFCCLYLDNRHRVIEVEELFQGTIAGASVHPREVVKRALQHNAAAVILAHNHPSGVAEPSRADEKITKRLKDALALIDVRVLDHIVIGATDTTSFAERGLL